MQLKRNKEMEFETLKKSYKKQIIIGALAICIVGGALTFATTRAKYKLTEDLELAKGTINYKPYDFKTMAMYKSEDGINYTEINTMPSSGYTINESKSYCTLDNKNKDTNAKLYTYQGKHVFENLAKSDKCYLYFDKKVPSASETILANITPKTTTPDFSQAATTDEGVYAVSDEIYGGTSYYWRGAVTNNYVKFANFCWRIVRINGDGSIRLIYDGTTCHANGTNTAESIAKTSVAYNSSYNQSYYVGWTYSSEQRPSTANPQTSGTASNAKTQLESWYNSNITGTNASKVADGKYCNDRTSITSSGESYTWAATGSTFYYGAYHRINTGAPTLSCPNGDIYSLKVGLITADEVMYAGGKFANNTSYYLYNGQNYWTMSPYLWNGDYRNAFVFIVRNDGYLGYYNVGSSSGLRPVINLKADTLFATGGNGTQSNPYVVE